MVEIDTMNKELGAFYRRQIFRKRRSSVLVDCIYLNMGIGVFVSIIAIAMIPIFIMKSDMSFLFVLCGLFVVHVLLSSVYILYEVDYYENGLCVHTLRGRRVILFTDVYDVDIKYSYIMKTRYIRIWANNGSIIRLFNRYVMPGLMEDGSLQSVKNAILRELK